ncbi:hypothetical protein F4803DRAFT_497171 [Xylaria telfairii]|nr:hypothetical protein F4803DRAFT_497171 [Xylaria telfairii]
MSPPLPLPSKAAIRALRSIALGTSCVIGVIVEDRRRRISTLQTAVENKHKLRSSRQYHHRNPEERDFEREKHTPGKHHDAETSHYTAFESKAVVDSGGQHSFEKENGLNTVQEPQLSGSQPSLSPPVTSQHGSRVTIPRIPQSLAITLAKNTPTIETCQPALSAQSQSQHPLILSIEDLLRSTDEKRLDRAVKLFTSACPPTPSSPLLESWLELSIRLSRECQASGRWEDASQILTTVISVGPLDESKYLAYDPASIIEYHLRRQDPDVPPSKSHLTSATKIFLPRLKAKPQTRGTHMERLGMTLMDEAWRVRLFRHHSIYWRTLHWAENPVEFVCWAIYTTFQHGDHKKVVNIFLLHYSRMKPPLNRFNETMDRVMESVLAMKGLNADEILEAFVQMDCPENGKFRSRWVMQLLLAHWARHEDLSRTIKYFEKAVSLGLLDRIAHPEGVYRTLVELAVKAGDEKVAYTYANELIRDHPNMKKDITLKLSVFKAKAGDWDGVLQDFRQVQPSELPDAALYTSAFILILGVFADSHSAASTQEFATIFIQDMGIGFHSHIVTIVANKYGKERDMKGFLGWLELCRREGFEFNAGICNTVLHHCSTKWKLSSPELRAIHSRFQALNPHCSDEVTQRILNHAASREGRMRATGHHDRKAIIVNSLTYRGRTTNPREVYGAMNKQLTDDKPLSAVMLYRRAVEFGMRFHMHCFRLVILATLRAKGHGSDFALSLLQAAHAEGHDVELAVTTFIRHEIDTFAGNAQDILIHMRNLLGRLESSDIPISPAVLTHMASVCVRIRQYEKAIVLCNLARDRSGAEHPFLSKNSFRVLASAYSLLLDFKGMNFLVDKLTASEFAADRAIVSHLKSVRRLVKKMDPSDARAAMLEILDRGVLQVTQARTKARTEGKLISYETLRIFGDAVAGLREDNTEESTEESMPQLLAPTPESMWEECDPTVKRQNTPGAV